MLKSCVRRIGVEKLADAQLLQFAQSGELLGVNDGDHGWRKSHGPMNAEKVKRTLMDATNSVHCTIWGVRL